MKLLILVLLYITFVKAYLAFLGVKDILPLEDNIRKSDHNDYVALKKLYNFSPPISNFTFFDFNANYMINGTIISKTATGTTSHEVYLIVNSLNNRYIIAASDGSGYYLVTEKEAYVFGSSFGGFCFNEDFTFQDEMNAYANAFHVSNGVGAINKQLVNYDTWTGLVHDFTSCDTRNSFYAETVNLDNQNVFYLWAYGQNFPVDNTCVSTFNIIKYDLQTYQTGIDYDRYFPNPSSCSSPASYCFNFYPDNNPCTD